MKQTIAQHVIGIRNKRAPLSGLRNELIVVLETYDGDHQI